MAFSLAEDRGLSRSRFNRHSPGFNQHSPVSFASCFGLQMRELLSLTEACLAVASIGPLLVSIGTRLFRLLRASVRRCGNGFLFSQRPRPVSLWNEVPLTLIARRWRCAFFLSDSNGILDVKDTVLRRQLASIALATRKTKNFFRGMLSAFRAGVSVVVGFHKPCCLVICSLQSPWLGVIFYPAYADRTD